MNILKVLILVGIIGGAYNYVSHRYDITTPFKSEISLEEDENGFTPLPPAAGHSAGTIYVVAARNCPSEVAQRANRLAEDLSREGLPVQRVDSIAISGMSPNDNATIDRVTQILNGPLPIVFISGRAKTNPTFDEVLAEFKSNR